MMLFLAAVRWTVMALLLLFFARRLLVLVASMLPRPTPRQDSTRTIALIVAARNESAHLPGLLAAIEALDYPASHLQVVLVSDGSTDATASLMSRWRGPFATEVVALEESRGKGGALAAGLARARPSDLVLVLDADCLPRPDVARILSGAFDDESVGGAAGYPRPENADATMVARYAALERWTHHLVWLAGKDRLRLDPSLIGVVFAVRRSALTQVGGFPAGSLTEDIDLSSSLIAAGWRLRWLGEAVVRENVVEDRASFVTQRTRWTRGLMESAHGAGTLEELFVAAGYVDRLVLLSAFGLAALRVLSMRWPLLYLLAPALTIVCALRRAEVRASGPYLRAAAVMAVTDVVTTLRSIWGQWRGTAVRWGGRA